MAQNIIIIIESILWIIVLIGCLLIRLGDIDIGFKVSIISGGIFTAVLFYFGIVNNTPLNNMFMFVAVLGAVMIFSTITYLISIIILKIKKSN